MSSCPNLVVEPLISQALLGTSIKNLDLSFLPDAMQPSAEAIKSTSPDQESCLFKIAALLIAQDQTAISLECNSFSLEQMSLYQQAVETDLTAPKTSKKSGKTRKASSKEQSIPSEGDALGNNSSQEPQCSQKSMCSLVSPLDKATVKAIISEVKKHKGPMPLPQVMPDERPVFPKSVEDLFDDYPSSLDNHKVLLFQTLQQLSACNMRFSESFFPKLVDFFNGAFRTLDYHFSSVMCQELLLKCGGTNFLYVLPFYVPRLKSIFFKLPYRTGPVYAVGDYSDGSLDGLVKGGDWEKLFQKATYQDALGLFIKLRHDNPALARNLLSANAMKFRPDPLAELINSMEVNLSLDDENFLLDMVRSDQSVVCAFAAKRLLAELHGSQYAQNCAQVVKEHLRYESEQGQWIVEPIYPKDSKTTSLGIVVPKFASNTVTNECLLQLLNGMDWEDLCDLTKSSELKKVFATWDKFDLFKSYELNVPDLLARKIYAAKDQNAASIFVKFYTGRIYWLDSTASIFMLLHGQERINAVKAWRAYNPSPNWLVELDYTAPLYKVHYLDEAWLDAIIQACLDNARESMDDHGLSRIFEVMNPNCMPWLRDKFEQTKSELGVVQDELTMVREKIDQLSPSDEGFKELVSTSQELSFKRRMALNKQYLVGSLMYLLLFKIKMAQLLEGELRLCTHV